MSTVTTEVVQQLAPKQSKANVALLTLALSAYEAQSLETYLAALSMEQAWDLYDIAGDLDIAFSERLGEHEQSFVSAVNWIALCAKARGQGY